MRNITLFVWQPTDSVGSLISYNNEGKDQFYQCVSTFLTVLLRKTPTLLDIHLYDQLS